MITLMFITMMAGALTFVAVAIIFWLALINIVFFFYLIEGISLLIAHKKLQTNFTPTSFIPVVRGYGEGKIVSKLLNHDEAASKKTIGFFLSGHFIYGITAFLFFVPPLVKMDFKDFNFVQDTFNAVTKNLDELGFVILIFVLLSAASYIILTIKRFKATRATGMVTPLAFLLALVAPVWAFTTSIYFIESNKPKVSTPVKPTYK